ncbi:MAG: DUF4398 domain-containing protein [Gammaproteobacteria bacterium]|nr:DUF4398 domain-containing protein [Gammaproteobacteria bacterium]MBA3731670.1 DUF4398 domain-containing protein [Gammaproteobacteria bacterium]
MRERAGRKRRYLLLLIPLLAVGCASTPPVQEMSNARQAMQAARAAHADQWARSAYVKAQAHILHAESALENGNYRDAREHANWAKTHALEARQRALMRPAGDESSE